MVHVPQLSQNHFASPLRQKTHGTRFQFYLHVKVKIGEDIDHSEACCPIAQRSFASLGRGIFPRELESKAVFPLTNFRTHPLESSSCISAGLGGSIWRLPLQRSAEHRRDVAAARRHAAARPHHLHR